tara:strand:+ start:1127 stop:1990 length:864 start_codon:yes stop_codon:yes gene_type:complete
MLIKNINNLIKKADIGLVVLSSQAYKELWPIFFKSWNKYHPKIKIKKYIISSEENFINKKYNFKVVSGVRVNKNSTWSARIRAALKKVNHKNLFFSTEDMIFYKNGNLSLINDFFEFYYNNSLLYLKSSPTPPILNNKINKKFVRDTSWALHQVSLQPALINKNFLIDNLINDDDSRTFEERASYKNRNNKKIFTSREEIFPYKEIVIGGKIIKGSESLFKNVKLKLPKKLNIMSFYENLKFMIFKKFKAWLLYKFPISLIKFLITNDYVGYKKKIILDNKFKFNKS